MRFKFIRFALNAIWMFALCVVASAQKAPAQAGVSLAGYPGVVAAYRAMEKGYTDKNPALVAAVWSPDYRRAEREGGKTTTMAYAQAVSELKQEFPGNRTEAGFYGPTQYFLPQSIQASADGARITVTGVSYRIIPNKPQGDPNCKEGNSCGSHPFTHVWSKPKNGGAWLLLTDERGEYSEAADKIIGDRVGEAIEKNHQRAGLLGTPRAAENASSASPGKSRKQDGADAQAINGAIAAACQAAYKGDLKTLQKLFDTGADVKTKDKDGKTPLHYAALGGRVEAARWLLANGADINARDAKDATPLALARQDTQDAQLAARRAALISFLADRGAAE